MSYAVNYLLLNGSSVELENYLVLDSKSLFDYSFGKYLLDQSMTTSNEFGPNWSQNKQDNVNFQAKNGWGSSYLTAKRDNAGICPDDGKIALLYSALNHQCKERVKKHPFFSVILGLFLSGQWSLNDTVTTLYRLLPEYSNSLQALLTDLPTFIG